MISRARRVAALALVLIPLAVALVPIALPPWRWSLVVLRIAAAAVGPYVAVAAIALGLAADRLGRPHQRLRPVTWTIALAAAALALAPAVAARRAGGEAPTSFGAMPGAYFGALGGLPAPGGVEERMLRYSTDDGSPLTLRRYRDPRRCAVRCPTVVVLYGGAWRNGDASQSAPVDRWLAGHGYTVVALDYRHAPAHRFPAQPADVRRGLTLVRDSADAWGADPERVVLWGRSSGGHLATLVAWDTVALPVRVRGTISYYAPFDLPRGYADVPVPDPIGVRAVLRDFVGGPPDAMRAAYEAASPRRWVRPGLPPALLVYAGGDHLVKPLFGRAAAAALRAAGDSVTYVEVPLVEHGFDLAHGGPGAVAGLHAVARFLTTVLPVAPAR